MLDELLQQGVKQTGSKSVSVKLDADAMAQANEPSGKPDDFDQLDVQLTLLAALDYSEKSKDKTPADLLAEKLTALGEGLKPPRAAPRPGFFWEFYAPFFSELTQKGYAPTLAYLVQSRRPDVPPDVTAWLAQHPQQLKELNEWAVAYQWPK